MTTLTKEQLIEEAKQAVEGCRRLLRVSPEVEAHKISLRLAEIALASLTAEPVAWLWSNRKHPSEVTLMHPDDDERAEAAQWSGWSYQALYAEPPASVVPDEKPMPEASKMYAIDAVAAIAEVRGWNACRTAMLEGADGTLNNEGTMLAGNSPVNPDGWISVSERMPDEIGRYWCYVEEQNSLGKSHYQWNCSWNGEVWSDKALSGRVTHWMLLPAAPQQEKN